MESGATNRLDGAAEATVQHLRAAAHQRVETTSLRGAAREIGLSPTGLKKFLMGTSPYSTTLRRLRRWYLEHGATAGGELTYEAASAALSVLCFDFDRDTGVAEKRVLLLNLAAAYDLLGREPPAWIARLQAENLPH